MIRALILYFLSIRPTHGYDIQRFIEINGMDQWTKIQLGSIYYALNKLEKEGFIYPLREERNGARVRKVYSINDSGKEELRKVLKEELLKPIDGIESEKFMIYIMFNKLTRNEIISYVKEHIKVLKDKKLWWERNKKLNVSESKLKSEVLHFDVVIEMLKYQIKWHETLIEEVDDLLEFSNEMEMLIGSTDFENFDELKHKTEKRKNLTDIEKLTDDIVKNPNNLEEKLAQLINLLKAE